MKLDEINIRDPFILPYENRYYMYGSRVGAPQSYRKEDRWGPQSGFDVYISENLEDWSEPKSVFERQEGFWGEYQFWAPEVHAYQGKFYMLASFKANGKCRATHILVSQTPDGVFHPVSEYPATPSDWECLDGTLYVDQSGNPHMIFCHGWDQIFDGTVCEVMLSGDLSTAITPPRVLWKASDHPGVAETGRGKGYITDGPFLYKCKNGDLLAIWSSFVSGGYAELLAKSDNGDITGNWKVLDTPLWSEDGGHGMIFESFSGEKYFIFHCPNGPVQAERPRIVAVKEENGRLYIP